VSNSRVVYSTDAGRRCPECGRPAAECRCKRSKPAVATLVRSPPTRDGSVLVARETQGRGGKGVTVVSGLPLAGAELETLARQLKQRCGSGGRLREDGVLEIQGEHRDRLVLELGKLGYRVKRAGG
jgi:translation initiation factor 1